MSSSTSASAASQGEEERRLVKIMLAKEEGKSIGVASAWQCCKYVPGQLSLSSFEKKSPSGQLFASKNMVTWLWNKVLKELHFTRFFFI